MEKFALGLVLGGLGGALLAANSCKMRTLVRKGQEEVKAKLDQMMDEKIREMESAAAYPPQPEADKEADDESKTAGKKAKK
ncbi:MAG: hypothetical protein IJ506_01255 [Clostridia bacterium]|nr:hypothetical protein [Clostridia bacterium]